MRLTETLNRIKNNSDQFIKIDGSKFLPTEPFKEGDNDSRKKNRERLKSATLNLEDFYIKQLLTKDGFRKNTINKDVIEIKRLIIKTKRLTTKKQNTK